MTKKQMAKDRQADADFRAKIINDFGAEAIAEKRQQLCASCCNRTSLLGCSKNLVPLASNGEPCPYQGVYLG